MKQHPFRIRLPRKLVSSVQFRFAVTFTILVAILLALMNTYPTRASRDIVFTEKQSALTNRAAVVSSSLSLLDNLTPDNTRQVLALLDLRDLTRIIVTDSEGLAVYDSASENNIRGKYVLYPELVRALARMVGVPLPTTSANLHGLPAAGSFSDLDPRLVAEADLTLDAGELPLGVASTIVDCTAGRPRIVREGPIAPGAIEEVAHGARGHSVSLS